MASELEEGGYFPSGSGPGETSHPPAPDGEPPPGSTPSNSAHMIAREHCYSKLGPLRDSPSVTALPTVVLFPDRIRGGQSNETSPPPSPPEDRVPSPVPSSDSKDPDVDVVTMDPIPDLPYDERKVRSIMLECSRHLNLVRPLGEATSLPLERVVAEAGYHQRILLSRLVRILEGDLLARLACSNTAHEPIKRRLNTDKAARQFRKALSDINWDSRLTRWSHETLLQILDTDLLPIYLDVLQVLKSKCPVLVEHMIHSSVSMVGGEAFGLLLKRPWNPVIGMQPLDRQVRFEPSPLFITLPYSSRGLGGRRWRLWQSQLSSLGKVYPIMLPEWLTNPAQGVLIDDLAREMVGVALARVQELRAQFPTRPVVLFGWSLGARIACKIAEVESIACIVSLGLPVIGVSHEWEVSSDSFKTCKTPTIFIIGTNGLLTSVEYVERLRVAMACTTSLLVIGGGDDLLRLSPEDKHLEETCQSIVDRCILEKIYEFLVHVLPSSYPDEPKHNRRRKSSHTEDIGATFLTPAVPHTPIVLTSPADDGDSSHNFNFNNSNPLLWKTVLGLRQGRRGSASPASRSGSSSPVSSLYEWSAKNREGVPAAKRPLIGELPKVGRPRSKSTTEKQKKKPSAVRNRSKSSDHSNPPVGNVTPNPTLRNPQPSNTFTPIPFLNLAANSNSNNSNSNEISPPQILSLPQTHFRPLPITPPRNPFEDPAHKLDPKTLKHLQRR